MHTVILFFSEDDTTKYTLICSQHVYSAYRNKDFWRTEVNVRVFVYGMRCSCTADSVFVIGATVGKETMVKCFNSVHIHVAVI